MEESGSRFKFLHQAYKFLVGFCISVILLPICALNFGSLFFVRKVVDAFLIYKYNGRFKLLHPMDATCSYKRENAQFASCFFVKTDSAECSLDKLRQKLTDNPEFQTGPYKKLQYRLCTRIGFSCWEDMSIGGRFNISDHVKLFPGVSNKPIAEFELMRLLNQCINCKRSSTANIQPDWDILVIPQAQMRTQFSSQNSNLTALILRINHGYMDGNSAFEWFRTCILDNEENCRLPIDMMNERGNRPLPMSSKVLHFGRLLVYGPMYVFRAVFSNNDYLRLSPNCPSLTERTLMLGLSNFRLTSASMNRMRVAFGVNSKTVIIFAYLTALRITAERKGIKLPNYIKMAITHAKVPYSKRKLENRFSPIVKCLPLSELSLNSLTGIERLIEVNAYNEHEADATFWLLALLGLLPNKLLELNRASFLPFTTAITGVPLPQQLYTIQKALLETFIPVPPKVNGLDYACAYHNYGGRFIVSFLVKTTDMIENKIELVDFVAEFDNCLKKMTKMANNMLTAKDV